MEILLNWLWQGGVVGLAAAALLKGLDRVRAKARCVVLWAAMLCVVGLPIVPLLVTMAAPEAAADGRGPLAPAVAMPVTWWTSWSALLGVWAGWAAVYAGRLVRAVRELREAKQRCDPFPPEAEARLRCWAHMKGTGRRTRLALSNDVRAAAVLGWGRPVIAVAPSLLEQLDDDDIDRVVIHEWSHVQRRDDLAQIVQFGVRILSGWHPAVWWLDRRLCAEREVACDEITVAITGDDRQYAACLATLGSLSSARLRSTTAMPAATAAALESRIVRILKFDRSTRRAWRPAAAGAVASVGALAFFVGGFSLVGTAASPTASANAPWAQPADVISVAGLEAWPAASTSPTFRSRQVRRRAAVAGAGRDSTRRETPAAEPSTSQPPPIALVPDDTGSLDFAAIPQMALTPSALVVRPQPSLHPTVLVVQPATELAPAPERETTPTSPWRAAADGGVAIGRGAQRAATATGGFFGRLGVRVADAF